MKLKTLNKTISSVKIEITYKKGDHYEVWHVDYLDRGANRHYDNLHYVDCMAKLPNGVMERKVMFVHVNSVTGALAITLEDKEV